MGDREPDRSTSGDEDEESEQTPVDTLELLGNKTRLEILLALQNPENETPMDFTDLYDYTDATHSSGFNYHLKKLSPKFIKRDENGYVLTSFGKRVAKTISAGTFADPHEFTNLDIEGTCVACGEAALSCSFIDGEFTVNCNSCGELILGVIVPSHLSRNKEVTAVVEAVDQWLTNWMQMSMSLFRYGICEHCGGKVNSRVIQDVDRFERVDVALSFKCDNCGSIQRCTVGAFASQHPKVKQFYYKQDLVPTKQRYWEVEQWMTNKRLEVLSEDPWKFCVTFDVGDRYCDVVVNGEPNIVDVTIR